MWNNPLRYIDPTGHRACGDGEEIDCNGHKQDPNQDPHLPKPKKDKNKDDKLTDTQLVGQVVTVTLIETTFLLPLDYALLELTTDGVEACLGGIALACIADIPIGAADVVAADFQISLANTVAKNIETHTQHRFEWLLIPKLLSVLPTPIQQDIYDALPGLEVKDD